MPSIVNLGDLLTDYSIDRVMAIDTNWLIIAWNSTSETATGLSRESVLGHSLTELFPMILYDHEMTSAIKNAFAGFKTFIPAAPGRFNRDHVENHFIPFAAGGTTVNCFFIICI